MCVQVKDPNTPHRPMFPKAKRGRETLEPAGTDLQKLNREYLDRLIEVFTLDGRLVASRRYDYGADTPDAVTVDLWYHIADDAQQSIDLFRPVLVAERR